MDVDGEMESGVRVRDGSEGDAMVVSSLSVIVRSLLCNASGMSEAVSKLLLELRVLSLSSSISSGALACNGFNLYCEYMHVRVRRVKPLLAVPVLYLQWGSQQQRSARGLAVGT